MMIWWLLSSDSARASTFMPPRGTQIAGEVDSLYGFLLWCSTISFVILIGGMCYFVWKYRRRTPNDKTPYITHNHTLEFLWSFIPFVLMMVVFFWGWKIYHDMLHAPEDALEVHVFAKKWEWRFVYKNGKEQRSGLNDQNQKQPPTMVVPVGRPVKLIMTSEQIVAGSKDLTDNAVIHSFFVPAFRIKQDVVPGRYSTVWFQAEQAGDYWVFCTEFCGPGHWDMSARVSAVSQDEFEKWLSGDQGGGDLTIAANDPLALAKKGKQIYQNYACIGCHSLDGKTSQGPTWKGLFGAKREFNDGTSATADDNYLRESILNPTAKVVKGFNPVMPPFAGVLKDDDLMAVIEFIKTIK